MAESRDQDAGQMRLAAVVIAVAMVAWIAVQWLGGHYGWAAKWAFLADLAAIGAFVWSLIVTWRIWRRRNDA
ncbi:DUF5337 family protein [Paracoccus sp. R12_1]|jgi:hypothetical protein|uniref:DUF5337 domain-containing protein n=1 Tax=Paracoccus maritimus TaxID=2933292 RepID=A0ABT2K8H6_9RHOB|nr:MULTISPECIES: DUF5337 family protein [unclassified Paracoccus (in: a-proteobacteria)]MBO9456307.1 DUF5337 family protein [Paracoccus sp. R12_2]MBO9487401.1 DUF5337 family protein [Paracoccus sp. R12_1]MCT4332691.1 DUF5337 domain-containing protein [Paracoccus sp. YLB-12]